MNSFKVIIASVALVFAGAIGVFAQTETNGGGSVVSSGVAVLVGASMSASGMTPPETPGVETMSLEFSELPSLPGPRVDTLRQFVPVIDLQRNPFALADYPVINPFLRDAVAVGSLGQWRRFHFTAEGRFSEKPFLLVSRGVAFGVSGVAGSLTYDVSVTAQNYAYMPLGTLYQIGVAGVLNYRLSDGVGVTAFANIYNVNPYFGIGAYPFVSTSRYGGYVALEKGAVGIDLGVQRYFDPFAMGWVTSPILTPKVKLWDSVTVSVPVGGILTDYSRNRPGPPTPGPGAGSGPSQAPTGRGSSFDHGSGPGAVFGSGPVPGQGGSGSHGR